MSRAATATMPITPWARLALRLAILEVALVRGLDYFFGDNEQANNLDQVVRALPLRVWGGLFLAGVAIVAVGMVWQRIPVLSVGHSLLAGLYAAVGVGLILQSGVGSGIRTGNGLLVGGVVLHLAFAWGHVASLRGDNERG